jgi:hypothetical protein
MERPAEQLKSDNTFALLGKQDPILQELWAIKAQINKDAHYNIEERRKQVQGLTLASARAKLGLIRAE